MRNYILCALCLLIFGCDKKIKNELTPKELEIYASEQIVEVCATIKIQTININSTGGAKSSKPEYSDGIIMFKESWFSVRVNRNNPDSCNVLKFHVKKNDSGGKRVISFRVFGKAHCQNPIGSITQNAQ